MLEAVDRASEGGKKTPSESQNTPKLPPQTMPKATRRCCSWFGYRHVITIFSFFFVTIAYAQRVNLSIAIVAMTDRNATLVTGTEYFNWDEGKQSTILSSFFWGYIITQIPAGQLAERIGPKIVLAVGLGVGSLFTLLSPLAAHGGWEWLCASRVIQGLGQGVLMPSTHALFARWSPPSERGRMATFAYAGSQVGTIVALSIGGLLDSTKGIGWPSNFYVFGAFGILWIIAWMIFGASTPDEHRWISDSERHYIVSSLNPQREHEKSKKLCTPWKSIATSVPFMAILIVHCGQNWGFWTLLTEIPTYMANVLNYDIAQNGLLSALPYLVMWIFSIIISWLSDEALEKGWLSVRIARKIGNTIGHWGPAVALIILGYIPSDQPTAALGLLTLAVGLNGSVYVGYLVNHIDLSPNFAGTLMGITNGLSNVMSILAPLTAGKIVADAKNADQWRIVFFVAAVIFFVCNLIYIIFGKGEIQPWNNPEKKETKTSHEREAEKEMASVKII